MVNFWAHPSLSGGVAESGHHLGDQALGGWTKLLVWVVDRCICPGSVLCATLGAHVGSLFGICGGMDPVGRLDDIAAVDVAAYVDVVLVEVGKHHQAVVVSGDHVGNIDSFRICERCDKSL